MDLRKLLFIGLPGSGKGTQAELLKPYGFKHISTGDLIREAWKKEDPLIMPYKESIEKEGKFLPNELIFKLIEKNLQKLKGYKGYILDGAVRTMTQAKYVTDKLIVDEIFYFSLSEKEAEKRLAKRRATSEIKRHDDDPKVIKERFELYKKQTLPILDYLKKHVKKYHEIDASPSVEKIHEEVVRILKLKNE